ncbi:MAG: hypothetical protein ABW213_09240 [Tardiphaga sp.]
MAHYYFDLKNGITERDHTGVELGSDAAAISMARRMAGEISRKTAPHQGEERHIRVIREDGHEVSRIRVAEAITP